MSNRFCITCAAAFVLVGVLAFAGATHQLFINTDGDVNTGYGPRGSDLLIDVDGVLRCTVPWDGENVAGWGETYLFDDGGDVLTGACAVPVDVYVLQDADLDGDIDLADFAEFQRLFNGPKGGGL